MPPIDPVLLAAHAMQTSPGVYALLVGSGVSSAAGIPTGWAITLDLVRRVAALEDVTEPGDAEAWHRERFGTEPEYSNLLDTLGATNAERQAIIRAYIEPTEEERSDGLKVPTAAHHAIGQLAVSGHVKIILTTNFDRLIEDALTKAGVDYDTIASVDALAGARPIGQAPCVVVKLHGDYRDARILNTDTELAAYAPEFDRLLDRVLDEYGLIICGWSATWDPALRAAIVRQPNRRYTAWWAKHGNLTTEAREVAEARSATVIDIGDADSFLTELSGKVAALVDFGRPHPLTVASAVAELKRYLTDPASRIRLRDLLVGEANRVHDAITDQHFPTGPMPTSEGMQERVARYEAISETLVAMLAVAGAWSTEPDVLREAVERVANSSDTWAGYDVTLALRRYPALLCFYAAGLAAAYADRWDMVRAIAIGGRFHDRYDTDISLAPALNVWDVLGSGQKAAWLPETGHTPETDHVFTQLRDPLRDTIPDDARYAANFDRFQYVMGLVVTDTKVQFTGYRATVGRIGRDPKYTFNPDQTGNRYANQIEAEITTDGNDWPPLRAGLFSGNSARLQAAVVGYREVVDWATTTWW